MNQTSNTNIIDYKIMNTTSILKPQVKVEFKEKSPRKSLLEDNKSSQLSKSPRN